jgi:CelD/BcsL family acetyltransferase involved in cellulose biosynthesis
VSTAPSINFTLITTREAFLKLEPEWDRLLARTTADSIFLSWTYVKTWLEHASPRVRLAVGIARHETGELVGIAPFCTTPGRTRLRGCLRHLTLLGGQFDSLAEYGDLIIQPGLEEEIGSAFARLLLTSPEVRWDLLCLKLARAGSTAMQTMLRELPRHGEPATTTQPAWVCALEPSWEAQLARYSSRVRQMIRSRERNLLKEFPSAAMHIAGQEISITQALDVLIRLNRQRWGGDGTAFHTDTFIKFHRDLAVRLAEEGRAAITLLHVDGAYIAARYDYLHANRVLNFQSGWDPAWADHSISIVLLAMTVRHYLEKGCSEYDFMAGDARYKREWSTRTEPLLNVEMLNPGSLRARVFFSVRKLRAFITALRNKNTLQAAPSAA